MPSNKNAKRILPNSIPCFSCHKEFITVASLMDHLKVFHQNLSQYDCIFCPSDKDTLIKYRRHILQHTKLHSKTANNEPNVNLDKIFLDNNDEDLNLEQNIVENEPMIVEDLNPPIELVEENFKNKNIEDQLQDIYNTSLINLLEVCSYPDMTFKRAFEFSSQKNKEHLKIIDLFKNFMDTENLQFKNTIEKFKNNLKNFNTEYLFLKHLTEIGIYSPPIKDLVGSENRMVTNLGINEFNEVNDSICILDFKFMLKSLFERKNIGQMILNKIDSFLNNDDGKLKNFVQGEIWKDILKRNPGKTIVPYFLYDDDIEIASPVGHNTSKQMLSIYTIHFPVVEDYLLAKTELMFPVAIAKTSDTKKYLKDYIINSLTEVMNELATDGIEIKIGDNLKKVHFILGLVIGDNKAMNEMLGFTGSFIHRYCCRQCIMPIEDRSKATVSDPNLNRKIQDYDEHLISNEYGLVRRCNFNKISEFHAYRNHYSDIFHDVTYLVIKDGVDAVIQDGIRRQKFTIEDLKRDFNVFDYGKIDASNRLDLTIFDSKGKLRLTGKEYTTFLKYFTFVLGHYYDVNDEKDEIFLKYVHILEDLFDLCNAQYYNDDRIELLREKVKKHHEYYLENIPEEKTKIVNGVKKITLEKSHLKYKPHNLTHYHETVKNSGPLKYLSTIRLESHLRDVKKYASATPSRINLPLTIGKKYAMKFALFLKKYDDNDFKFVYYSSKSKPFDSTIEPFENDNLIFSDINLNLNDYISYRHIDYKGTSYRSDDKQYVLLKNSTDNIYKIWHIISSEENNQTVFLAVERFNVDHFDVHYNAYVLGNSQNLFYIYNIEKFGFPLNIATLQNRKQMFKINKYNYS